MQMRVMQQAANSRQVKARIYAMWCVLEDSKRFVEAVLKTGICTGIGNTYFKIGPAKLFLDGSSSGPTCATREPYTSMPNYSGLQYYPQEEVDKILGAAHKLVVPIPNPAFFYEFGDGYLRNYGEKRVNVMFPAASYVQRGIIAAGGSDAPVTTYNPLRGIASAVNRLTESGQSTGTDECVSILEALRMFTYNGAYASFEENIKGSLEVGKLADIIVLSEPILDVDEDRIADLCVDLTMIDGEIVYNREG